MSAAAAFAHPVTAWILGATLGASLLLLAVAVIGGLTLAGRGSPALRRTVAAPRLLARAAAADARPGAAPGGFGPSARSRCSASSACASTPAPPGSSASICSPASSSLASSAPTSPRSTTGTASSWRWAAGRSASRHRLHPARPAAGLHPAHGARALRLHAVRGRPGAISATWRTTGTTGRWCCCCWPPSRSTTSPPSPSASCSAGRSCCRPPARTRPSPARWARSRIADALLRRRLGRLFAGTRDGALRLLLLFGALVSVAGAVRRPRCCPRSSATSASRTWAAAARPWRHAGPLQPLLLVAPAVFHFLRYCRRRWRRASRPRLITGAARGAVKLQPGPRDLGLAAGERLRSPAREAGLGQPSRCTGSGGGWSGSISRLAIG